MARHSHGDSGEYAHFRMRHSLEEEALELEHLRARNYAASYFSVVDPSQRVAKSFPSSIACHPPSSIRYAKPVRPATCRHGSAHHNQLLYVVTFKCSRSDVFYIQEGQVFR
jgi:hypothetical protein